MLHTFAVGDFRVDRIVEQEIPGFDPLSFLPGLTGEILEENRHWLEPHTLDPESGLFIMPMQSYVVRTGRHTILVDSCVGNHKERPTRPAWHRKDDSRYLDGLARAGLRVEDIDFVLCTHLHADHVGWNTRLENDRWVPTFPNARYLFSGKELAYWQEQHARKEIPQMTDSVLPVIEAGRAIEVRNDHAVEDGVYLEPTPGHTPDHFAVHLASGGAEAVMCGDLIHVPLQCRYPELGAHVDFDKPQAIDTRRRFMDRYCETPTLVCTAHFHSPSIGHFRRHGDAFDFAFRDED